MRILLALVLLLVPSHAASAVELTGNLTQGGLVTGRTQPGAKVLLGDRAVLVGKDGLFVFGFGRDQAPNAQLTIIQPDGSTEQQTLAIEQRKFDIQRIDSMEQSKVTPNPADLARIKSDQEKINAVRGDPMPAEDFLVPFVWPAQGPISGVYGSQRILNGEPRAPHYGLDIAAPEGSPVIAPAPGTVRLVASRLLPDRRHRDSRPWVWGAVGLHPHDGRAGQGRHPCPAGRGDRPCRTDRSGYRPASALGHELAGRAARSRLLGAAPAGAERIRELIRRLHSVKQFQSIIVMQSGLAEMSNRLGHGVLWGLYGGIPWRS